MKKYLGILVAITLCFCMLIPATATDVETEVNTGLEDILGEYFGDIDVSSFSAEEIEAMLADLDLGSLDIDSLLADFKGTEKTDEEVADEEVVDEEVVDEEPVGEDVEETPVVEDTTGSVLDLTWLTNILSGEMDTDALTEMFSTFQITGLEDLLAVISESMSGAGVNLDTFDLSAIGNVDVANLLSSTGSSSQSYATTDLMAGLADTILSGLESLGLDTTTIEAMLDNEIVNFFANLYIGYVDGTVEEPTESTTAAPTTKVPAVVTTEVPKTGDTSAVFAAIATLSVASAAAFVCLKKKEN